MPSWLRNISTFFSGHWDCSTGYSCGCARFDTIVSYFNGVECCSASWHEAYEIQSRDPQWSDQKGELRFLLCLQYAVHQETYQNTHFAPSHLDCNVKGAALFSPFASPNKSRWTLQTLKAVLWHQVGFGVPITVFTPVFICSVSLRNCKINIEGADIQPSTWQLVSRSH